MRRARVTTPAGTFDLRAQSTGPEGYGIDITEPAGLTAETLLAAPTTLLVADLI